MEMTKGISRETSQKDTAIQVEKVRPWTGVVKMGVRCVLRMNHKVSEWVCYGM